MAHQNESQGSATSWQFGGGLEELLGMAAVEPRLAAALAAAPVEVAAASGVALTAAEVAVLQSVSYAVLKQMAAGIGKALCASERRAFLQRAAVALLGLGGTAALGVAGCGARAEPKKSQGKAAREQESDPRRQAGAEPHEGERRLVEAQRRSVQELRSHPPAGILPDLPPKVFPLGVEVQGALEAEKVRQSMISQMAPVLRCYVTVGLAANPRLAGELKLRAAVRPDGAVADLAVIERYLAHPPTEKCAVEGVRAWRLPAPTDGRRAMLTFRLVFTPGSRRWRNP